MRFYRILIPLILLSYSYNSFAIGPVSAYFGFSASATSSYKSENFFNIDTSLLKAFSTSEVSKTTNRKFSGIVGARLFSLRFEGAFRYSPSGILTFQDQSNEDVSLLYSSNDLSGTLYYDIDLVPILVPYIGLKAGYCNYNFTKTASQEKLFNFDNKESNGIYAAGVLGVDLRLSDFIALGINYSLDYMPFLEKAKVSIEGNEKKWNNKNKPIFHNLGLIIKFGI